jgi:sulfur carrier protein
VSMGMKIQVNGEDRDVPEGMTVAGLARQLDVRPDRVAVEVNLQILDRQEFDRCELREGDHVEIISFIGGGAEEL